MKKYMTPEFDMFNIQSKDIVTVSGGEEGGIKSFSLDDIVKGNAEDWNQAN